MKCKQIKELVLTDYLDDQVSKEQKQSIEEHLTQCTACREFAAEAKEVLKNPFESVQPIKAPDHLWNKIEGAIEKHRQESLIQKAWDALSGTFAAHKPVFALSTVAATILLLVAVVKIPAWQTQTAANDYLNEQFEYLVYSDDQTDVGLSDTWVDEYFL
ncbi:MAG: zf-HC2 domain-containing protein [Candidatus Aceula meridiana]|nr:zf-HC2 domain-containing protein [Candidatus Aceula meridiana]